MQALFENMQQENPVSFLFIDGSYFCFYRYHSIMRWWKNAHPEIVLEDPSTNEIFVEKFRKTFVDTVGDLSKNLKIKHENPIIQQNNYKYHEHLRIPLENHENH